MVRGSAIGLAAVLAVSASQAWAETLPPLTTEQQASLGKAIFLWSRGLLGDPPAFTAVPADGHYALAVPIGGAQTNFGIKYQGGPATADVALAADGRWRFEALAYPSPMVTMATPEPGGVTQRTTQTIRQQSGFALIDPTLKTGSSWEVVQEGLEQRIEGDVPARITFERIKTQEEWIPASPGRVDMAMASSAEKLTAAFAKLPKKAAAGQADMPAFKVALSGMTVTSQAADVDAERMARLVREVANFGAKLNAKDKALTAADRAALHRLLELTRDLAREVKLSAQFDGGEISFDQGRAVIERTTMTEQAAAPDGKLQGHMRMEMAGLSLDVSAIPLAYRGYVPHKLAFAPFVSGLPVHDVYALLDRAIDDTKDDRLADDMQAALARSPVTGGIEELSFDVGPASLTAHGQVTAGGPEQIDGTARVEAHGVDALIKKVGGDPMLKMGVPVLIFLKGIGEQDGDKITWNVAYKDGALAVNGTDMSGMMPGK